MQDHRLQEARHGEHGNDGARAHQLLTWLNLPTAREQRRYLEDHLNLLDRQSETLLHDLAYQASTGSEQKKQAHAALALLQDARQRGGTVEAVCEAYINLHGGFVLDLPPWLQEVEQRLTELLNQKRPDETAEARTELLQERSEHVQEDIFPAPELLATFRRELADALRNHPRTNHAQALETAICIYEEVLHIYTLTCYPYQYATTRNRLGAAYQARLAGDQSGNQEQAIACYREALRVWTFETFPFEYAKAQNRLGNAYQSRLGGEQRKNQEQAIACYREALHVWTFETFPFEYALVQSNLGLVYWKRIMGERRENLEKAITCYHEALRVRTLETFPYDYASTQVNLGLAYWERIMGKRQENLERAISCYREALQVETLETFPRSYANTQNNLGIAYVHRVAGERWANLEQAIACYREALRVWTLDAFPFFYAMVQSNLGEVYGKRRVGAQRANLEQALACCYEALRVWTLDTFPFYYAGTQIILGDILRQTNLEQAITCYHEALRVYTLEAFPRESRDTCLNLAETEAQCGNWTEVHNAYRSALEAEDLLIILGAGTFGRDVILKEGRDASIRLGYTLHRLGYANEAAVAMEHGRARGLAEAVALSTADPALIADASLRVSYVTAREALIKAQADLHALSLQKLDEQTRQHLDLEYTTVYRQARANFHALVAKIRLAQDPADFLNTPVDATTLLRAATRVGPRHALVYLAATPWGGVAIAALSTPPQGSPSARFAALDLPDLTDAWVNALIETRLDDGSQRLIGGFAPAQMGEGFEQLFQHWQGATLQARIQTLHVACRKTQQHSTLLRAAQQAMTRRPFARLAKLPLAQLTRAQLGLLSATLDHLFLQCELQRCLEHLGTTVFDPLVAWVHEQEAESLTLIPCGHLATFPLTAVLLADGRSVIETLPTSLAPSARSLLHQAQSRSPEAGISTLGDPHRNLPWSEAEALTLTELARRSALPAEAYVKEQATRSHLLSALERRWMVDACCHATFDRQDFLRSSLRLAHGERIAMSELLSNQVDVRGLRLLLLSACQTALLDLEGARDEVHSLAAAMVQAGAQAVLASQWAVDDKATYLLMVRFVQEWLPRIEQEPPAVALARAQHWLRHVTNAQLASWHQTLPMPPQNQRLMRRKTATRWPRLAVRGRLARYTEEEAQLAIRIGAEEDDPWACPYADPYYWAGFQVIGW